jgi:hypothetical protein
VRWVVNRQCKLDFNCGQTTDAISVTGHSRPARASLKTGNCKRESFYINWFGLYAASKFKRRRAIWMTY